jgi:AAA15 family ATPase/GTPase
MLIEFRVENHRSLRDEQVLTMEAGRVGDETDSRPRHVPGHAEGLLPVAALYGANASGKSNVLSALAFMRNAVLFSHRSWSPEEGVPRDPFAWEPKKKEPSFFEVTLLLDEIRYQYGFVASDECFLEEWLHAWPNGKKQVWFERDGATFRFGDNLKGENRLIEEVTRLNALFFSAAVQHKHLQLQPISLWFGSLQTRNVSPASYDPFRHRRNAFFSALAGTMDDAGSELRLQWLFDTETSTEPLVKCFRTLLRNADIGIVDLRVDKKGSDFKGRHPYIRPATRYQLKHQSKSDDAWLPLEEESRGTQALIRLAIPILGAFQNGGTLLVDELDASLHPSLAQEIVRQFNDPVTNPHNAQLIFTTQDTNLLGTSLGEPALRRDQVWLTEKDADGATVLYPLTDYKPRKAENLQRGYLQGRYGAIPFLGDFKLLGTDSP